MDIQILIADDQLLFRKGMKYVLNREKSFTVVAEAENGKQAIELATALEPTIVLMNVELPMVDGIQATIGILKQVPTTKVLMLSYVDNEEHIINAIQAGAKGYLSKSVDAKTIVEAINKLSLDGFYLDSVATDVITKDYQRITGQRDILVPKGILTNREYEVLQLLAQGKQNRDLAAILNISEKTVKNHVSSILIKLNVSDRTQAVLKAIQNHWVKV